MSAKTILVLSKGYEHLGTNFNAFIQALGPTTLDVRRNRVITVGETTILFRALDNPDTLRGFIADHIIVFDGNVWNSSDIYGLFRLMA